jgi:hypothetical protein
MAMLHMSAPSSPRVPPLFCCFLRFQLAATTLTKLMSCTVTRHAEARGQITQLLLRPLLVLFVMRYACSSSNSSA